MNSTPRTINFDPHTPTMEAIKTAIANAGGSIPFSEYMELALYGPDGYYSSGRATIAAGSGDFQTWPMVSTDFCEAMAVAITKLWVAMGRPKTINIVESGAGNGVMMKDILVWLREEQPELYRAAHIHIIEPGELTTQQRRTIAGKNDLPMRGSRAEACSSADNRKDLEKVQWHRGSAIDFDVTQISTAIFISNELPDAFPVEVVRRKHGVLEQEYVELRNTGLVAIWKPLQHAVQEYITEFSVMIHEGYEVAINLNAVQWQKRLNKLHRGGIITIDYGNNGSREFKSPGQENSLKNTLRAALSRRTKPVGAVRTYPSGTGCLELPGELDMTADVDFAVLAKVATKDGLDVAFFGTQTDFLVACGVPTLEQISSAPSNIRTKATINMLSSGGFRALVLARGVTVDYQVKQ